MGDNDDLTVHQESNKNFEQRLDTIRKREIVDAKFGFVPYTETAPRNAWLVNFQPSEIYDEMSKTVLAATDFYFLDENAERFKISYPFRPYLYVASTKGTEFAVASYLSTRFAFIDVERVEKEDLDLKNHLSGLKSVFLKVSFPSVAELSSFKKEMNPLIKKNKEIIENTSEYALMLAEHLGAGSKVREKDISEQIIDMREHDLPYHMRVCIDNKIFAGLWYTVVGRNASTRLPLIKRNEDIVEPPDPIVCAFDIETTKLPLKFPDSDFDQIMMISYMIDGVGFLIINREIVSEDVEDFEYTPRPEFKGEFTVFNEPDEKAVVQKFFDHLLRVQPSVMVTYNGDFFDWPFVEARAAVHGILMNDYIGFYKDSQDEYKHNNCIHMDAFRWVVRDSYLPMGSQNLKATTKAKLRYDPVELDPELMLEMARHQPMTLASYSVSDAVATYYLYMKYVHPFIFALCTIIPLGPDDVLRKGSGTLCEALLMVEAFHKNIIFPNKKIMRDHQLTADGHLLNSETYVGGHVEALESGVFRADVSCKFRLDPEALMELREKVRTTMSTALETEMKINLNDVESFDDVCADVRRQLDLLIEQPIRNENPKIYHLDVGAMYPNIILTNRLQPPAVVTEEDCLACVYNHPDAKCKRHMNWVWRGEVIPASKGEYERLMQQLEQEKFGKPPKPFHLLPHEERSKVEKKRIQDFCRTAYGKLHLTRIETRTTTICQRENAFYVDTVLAFRDRRYEYKAMLKKAKNAAASVAGDDLTGQKMAQARVVLYESLQLAHKCILNSFYGYAMRKGSRWFSMEMAGIVCHTGANIIKEARELVERIGRPLELDTDGIWCLLPHSFPENFDFKLKSGKSVTISYPGAMLNELVKDKFTNDQYHTLMPDGSYKVSSENSIFFEVDGPYLAMILPASKEEGKKLKKRYAVFNFDGSLAELKGFEVKRRGELAIIKHFQTSVFKAFLKGSTLQEIYENVAKEADYWMDILFTKGEDLPNEELFDLIGENRSMSKKLEEYGSQKSTSITTAKRLAEFLGDDMVKNAGLACKFIISKYPQDAPVTERTIPLAIFQAEPSICCHYLRKWTKNSAITVNNIDVRELIDWNYYIERMGSCIQKIITIPAALQGIANPVPRVPHPNWLENKRRERIEMHTQPKITDMLKRTKLNAIFTNSTPQQKRGLTDSAAKTRKRFLPQEGYDESASNTNIFGRENDENSVSVFGGLIKDQSVLVSQKLHKRQKPDNYYDDYDDSNAMGFPDTNDGGDEADDEELIHLDDLTNGCNVSGRSERPTSSAFVTTTSDGVEFWKRPVKGKKFTAKGKSRSGPATFSALLSGKTTTDLSTLERKTWSRDGFREWLKYLKAKWDAQLALRRREQIKQLTNPTMTPRTMKRNLPRRWAGTNGGSMLHIIQICETTIPGQYTVYAVGEDGMRHFNLTVPRVFYVDDTKTRKESESCRLVQKVLPKMRPCSSLYEYTVDESQFSAHLNEFNTELCSMRISGIYETQTPLLFKAIVQLGGTCIMESVRNSLDISIEHLHKISKAETSYLDMDALRIMFFYEFTHLNRSVFALFAPSLHEGRIYIVNRTPVGVSNVEKLYKDEYKKFTDQRGHEALDERCQQLSLHVVQTTSMREASRELAVRLKAFKLSPSDPLVFCIQSARSGSSLVREFPFFGGHPHIRLSVTESPSIMGVLDWPNMMAKRSIQHFFNSFIYLKDYFYMASYIEMPVGNIVSDMPVLALDILYARQLRLRNHLLWASPSAKPDFGCKDLEDYRLNNTWETASFHQNTASIYNREAFVSQDIVVELALGAVAVTALIQSSRIAEAEGTSESISFTAGNATSLSIESAMLNRLALTNYDEGISASGALKVLKELFHHIVRDIHLEENIFADQMVVNMHRWIRNPSSLLYHPAVCEAVSTLMRKLCLLLVSEVNRLGGRVIHCSFTKIVLSTNRNEPRLARGFVESLLESLAQKPTFASLHLSVLQYSRLFVWIDPTNYALVKCPMDTDGGGECSGPVVVMDDQQRRKQVRLHFLMSNCLPEEGDCLKMFKSLIAGYLVKMAEKLDEENMSEDNFDAFCNELLMGEVTPTLFSLITKFVEIRHQLKTREKNRPVYLTSLDDFDVPLEFVKCVCKILSTNPYITLNLESVRSQLMRILQVDDAAPSSFWTLPPVNLALEYVFCRSCTQSTSLNVTTDVAEMPEGGLAFICPLCHSVLSSTMVEELLVDRVSRMVLAYTLQDYQCVRCKKISALQMDCRCECRNSFENTIPAADFRMNLMAVREVAKRHSLIDLEAHIAQIFQLYDETDSSNASTSKTAQNL